MLAFTGLMALLVIGGGTWVIRNRGHLEGETSLIFAALFAALIGRSVEQMLGVARISDMTVFWAVVAITTAVLLNSQRQTEAGYAESRPFLSKANIVRWGVATAIIAVMIPLMWQRNVPYVKAATLSSDAVEAFQERGLLEGVDLIDSAIISAPDVWEIVG